MALISEYNNLTMNEHDNSVVINGMKIKCGDLVEVEISGRETQEVWTKGIFEADIFYNHPRIIFLDENTGQRLGCFFPNSKTKIKLIS